MCITNRIRTEIPAQESGLTFVSVLSIIQQRDLTEEGERFILRGIKPGLHAEPGLYCPDPLVLIHGTPLNTSSVLSSHNVNKEVSVFQHGPNLAVLRVCVIQQPSGCRITEPLCVGPFILSFILNEALNARFHESILGLHFPALSYLLILPQNPSFFSPKSPNLPPHGGKLNHHHAKWYPDTLCGDP